MVADILLVVHWVHHSFAVVVVLLRLRRKWTGSLLRHIRWVHWLPLKDVGHQEFVVAAFDQTVLASYRLAAVVRLVVVAGLASPVEVVAVAHLKVERSALTAFVARHFAVHYFVPGVVLVIPCRRE